MPLTRPAPANIPNRPNPDHRAVVLDTSTRETPLSTNASSSVPNTTNTGGSTRQPLAPITNRIVNAGSDTSSSRPRSIRTVSPRAAGVDSTSPNENNHNRNIFRRHPLLSTTAPISVVPVTLSGRRFASPASMPSPPQVFASAMPQVVPDILTPNGPTPSAASRPVPDILTPDGPTPSAPSRPVPDILAPPAPHPAPPTAGFGAPSAPIPIPLPNLPLSDMTPFHQVRIFVGDGHHLQTIGERYTSLYDEYYHQMVLEQTRRMALSVTSHPQLTQLSIMLRLHIETTQAWHLRQCDWLQSHTDSPRFSRRMRECRNQLSFAMASIEHQLDEYENMISYVYRPSSYPEIYPGPVQDADVPHMRSEVQYYVDPMNPYLPILPGYDICNIFGKGNCALAYPGPFQPTIFNEENNNNEGATSESNNSPDPDPDRDDVDLRRHFILALDELGPGRIVDSMVHLGAVSMFDMNSPTMISLVHQLSNLQMIREQQVQVIDGYQTPTPVPTGVYEQTVTFDVRPQLVQMTNGEALTVAQQLVVAWSAPPQVT